MTCCFIHVGISLVSVCGKEKLPAEFVKLQFDCIPSGFVCFKLKSFVK